MVGWQTLIAKQPACPGQIKSWEGHRVGRGGEHLNRGPVTGEQREEIIFERRERHLAYSLKQLKQTC